RLGLRVGADEAIEVAALELVRLARQRLEVAHAVVARPGLEHVCEGEGAEGGVAAGAVAGDREARAVRLALGDQTLRGEDAVADVDLAPASVQALAVGAAEAGAAAVVDVDHGEAAAGPEPGREP